MCLSIENWKWQSGFPRTTYVSRTKIRVKTNSIFFTFISDSVRSQTCSNYHLAGWIGRWDTKDCQRDWNVVQDDLKNITVHARNNIEFLNNSYSVQSSSYQTAPDPLIVFIHHIFAVHHLPVFTSYGSMTRVFHVASSSITRYKIFETLCNQSFDQLFLSRLALIFGRLRTNWTYPTQGLLRNKRCALAYLNNRINRVWVCSHSLLRTAHSVWRSHYDGIPGLLISLLRASVLKFSFCVCLSRLSIYGGKQVSFLKYMWGVDMGHAYILTLLTLGSVMPPEIKDRVSTNELAFFEGTKKLVSFTGVVHSCMLCSSMPYIFHGVYRLW